MRRSRSIWWRATRRGPAAVERDEAAARRPVDVDEVKAALDLRDALDAGRAVSPLRAADDAVVIDTTNVGVEAIVADIVHRVHASEAR